MSETAALYRNAAMMSEEPTMQTLVTGLRGLRTYLARAARALELDNNAAKIAAVTRATELLTFMQGITQPEGEGSLGATLSGLYTGFHLGMTRAHAANDVAEFRAIATQIAQLEDELKKLAD